MSNKFLRTTQAQRIVIAAASCEDPIFRADLISVAKGLVSKFGMTSGADAVLDALCKGATNIPDLINANLVHNLDPTRIFGDIANASSSMEDLVSIIDNLSKTTEQLKDIGAAAEILNVKYDDIILYAQSKGVLGKEILPTSMHDQNALLMATQGLGSLIFKAAEIHVTIPDNDEHNPDDVYKFVIDCFLLLARNGKELETALDGLSGINKNALAYMNIFGALDQAVRMKGSSPLTYILTYANTVYPGEDTKLLMVVDNLLKPAYSNIANQMLSQSSDIRGSSSQALAANIVMTDQTLNAQYAQALIAAEGILESLSEQQVKIDATIMQATGNYFYSYNAATMANIKNPTTSTKHSSTNNKKRIKTAEGNVGDAANSIKDGIGGFIHFLGVQVGLSTDLPGEAQLGAGMGTLQDTTAIMHKNIAGTDVQKNMQNGIQAATRAGTPSLTEEQVLNYANQLEDHIVEYYWTQAKNAGIKTRADFSNFVANHSGTEEVENFYQYYMNSILGSLAPQGPANNQFNLKQQKLLGLFLKNFNDAMRLLNLVSGDLEVFNQLYQSFEKIKAHVMPNNNNQMGSQLFADTDVTFSGELTNILKQLFSQANNTIATCNAVFLKIAKYGEQFLNKTNDEGMTLKVIMASEALKIIEMMNDLKNCIKFVLVVGPETQLRVIDSQISSYQAQSATLAELNPYLAINFGIAIFSAGNQAINVLKNFQANITNDPYFSQYLALLDKLDSSKSIQKFVQYGNSTINTGQIYSDFTNFISSTKNKIQGEIAKRQQIIIHEMKQTGLIKR